MSTTPISTMEIEQKLAADQNGEQLRNLMASLTQGRDRVRAKIDAGVGAVDRHRLDVAHGAFNAGTRLLPMLWEAQRR